MRSSRTSIAAGLVSAWVLAATAGPAWSDSQTVQASVTLQGIASSGIIVGLRTSDIGAAFHTCTTTSSGGGCTVSDNQSSIPKNIGNIICLPSTVGAYSIDAACSMLLTQNSGSCQKNSAPSNCNQPQGSYSSVAPDCNYRTSSNAGTAASWTWTLVNSSGQTTLKCAQTGYQGTAP